MAINGIATAWLYIHLISTFVASTTVLAYGLSENCQLPKETNVTQRWSATCLSIIAGSYWNQDLTTAIDNFETPLSSNGALVNFNQLYISHHFNRHVSLHLHSKHFQQAWIRNLRYLSRPSHQISSYFQFGHTIFDRFSYTFGKFHLPFGINLKLTPNFMIDTYKDYWPNQQIGSAFTINPNTVTSYEIGVGHGPFKKPDSIPVSFRVNTTIPSLNGTKISGSMMQHDKEHLHYGIGLISNYANYLSSVEWVRKISRNDRGFSQIFRVNYGSTWLNDSRWQIEFEHLEVHGSLFTYSREIRFLKHLILQGSWTYQTPGKERNASRSLFGGGVKCEF